MAIRTILTDEIFSRATLCLGLLERGLECNLDELTPVIDGLRELAYGGRVLSVKSDPTLVALIDEGIRKLHREHRGWDGRGFAKSILGYADLLEEVQRGEQISSGDMRRAFLFCEEFWVLLGVHKMREHKEAAGKPAR